MWSLTHGPLDTRDPPAPWDECVAQEQLMDIVPGAASGRSHPSAFTGGHRGPGAASGQTGTLAGGAAGAVSAIDRLVCHMPIRGERHVGVPTAEVWLHRLRLVLTTGRDTPVESDCQGMPPEDAMAQGDGRRSVR